MATSPAGKAEGAAAASSIISRVVNNFPPARQNGIALCCGVLSCRRPPCFAPRSAALSSLLLTLPLKMACAAAIVVIVSMIAERARPFFAAMVATLPVSAGPSLLFLSLDHDDSFMAATLLAAMVANLSSCAYILAYAHLAQRKALAPALGGAMLSWIVAGSLLRPLPWTLPGAVAATLVLYPLVFRFTARFTAAKRSALTPRSRYALLLRATGVATLVALVTLTSAHVGPYVSAFLAVFPIVLSSLVVILQPRLGGAATAAFIAQHGAGARRLRRRSRRRRRLHPRTGTLLGLGDRIAGLCQLERRAGAMAAAQGSRGWPICRGWPI